MVVANNKGDPSTVVKVACDEIEDGRCLSKPVMGNEI